MLLGVAYLIYMNTFCKVLGQKLKYVMRYQNFRKSFKNSFHLNYYIIDVKMKKFDNKLNHSEGCAYNGRIIMITIKQTKKYLKHTKESLQISRTTFLCIVHNSLGLPLNEG